MLGGLVARVNKGSSRAVQSIRLVGRLCRGGSPGLVFPLSGSQALTGLSTDCSSRGRFASIIDKICLPQPSAKTQINRGTFQGPLLWKKGDSSSIIGPVAQLRSWSVAGYQGASPLPLRHRLYTAARRRCGGSSLNESRGMKGVFTDCRPLRKFSTPLSYCTFSARQWMVRTLGKSSSTDGREEWCLQGTRILLDSGKGAPSPSKNLRGVAGVQASLTSDGNTVYLRLTGGH